MSVVFFIGHFPLQATGDGGELDLESWMEATYESEFDRTKSCLADIGYMLSKSPQPQDWDDNLRTNFVAGCQQVIAILKVLQVRNYYYSGSSPLPLLAVANLA